MSEAAADFLRRRRGALAADPDQLGIDYLAVGADPAQPGRRLLLLHFVPGKGGAAKVPKTLVPGNFRFTAAGVPVDGLFSLDWKSAPPTTAGSVVTVPFEFQGDVDLARRLGDSPVFTLELTGVPSLDPFFARADFSLDPQAPRVEDCDDEAQAMAAGSATTASGADLASDYLAKDYASFRQRMLDNLAQRLPQWSERSPADLLVTLVELLADAGDQASYYQDAVATEAYLGTARRRISVRRHARLVGYRLHEGTNARTWVRFTVSGSGPDGFEIPAGTQLLTRVPGLPFLLPRGSAPLAEALAAGATVFETLAPVTVHRDLDAMKIYAWGADRLVLPQGATSAFLVGRSPNLKSGVVLILEQARGEATGAPDDANPGLRHAVRLTVAVAATDPLGDGGPVDLTRIEWEAADALPFTLPLANRVGATRFADLAVARGNVGLADHGLTVKSELLEATGGRFRPRLSRRGLTHRVPFDAQATAALPAASALAQDGEAVLPALDLQPVPADAKTVWNLKGDLLSSDRFARDYVVEMESDGTAVLRFGDGTLGRPPEPGSLLAATYRVGNGAAGNLGHGSLYHLVSDDPLIAAGIAGLTNPLPAVGGTDPETIEHARIAAPGAIDVLTSGTAVADVVAEVESFPGVERAAARLRWTGSWYLLEVAVARTGGQPLDADFSASLAAALEDRRIAGWEIAVVPLDFVGLDIALTAVLAPDAIRGQVERALLDRFSNRDLPGGRRGFFHPANLAFGQPVYLSQIVAAALAVPGVRALETDETPPRPNRFHRFGEPSRGELAAGEIRLGRNEIARVDNDPAAPENGRIQFYLEGGR